MSKSLHGPRLGDPLYRLALLTLPRSFRSDFAREILIFHADQLRDSGGSRITRMGIWIRAMGDVLFHALLERAVRWFSAVAARISRNRTLHTPDRHRGNRRRNSHMGDRLVNALRELRYAVRGLARAPGYSFAFVLTLGLGIGANTAIFSVVNGVLLQPLPNRDGDRVVYVRQTAAVSAMPNATFSVPEIIDYRAAATTLEGFAEFSALTFTMLGEGEPRRVRSGIVTGNYFDVLGLVPILGRNFDSGDDGETADPVMMLTQDFWLRAFGGDSTVVGHTARMNGRTIVIVGILEPAPHYPERIDVFVNMVSSPHHMSASMGSDRMHRMTQVFARLTSGNTIETATVELHGIAGRLADEYPETYEETTGSLIAITKLKDELTKRARLTLYLLIATAGFVLVIACSNVANLTLTRSIRRERELAVRAMLGAGRASLRRLLLTENLLLSMVGAMLGLTLAVAGGDLLVSYAARFTPRATQIELDGAVLLFTLVVAAGAAVLIAFVPRIPADRYIGSAVARAGTRTTGGLTQKRLQQGLVVGQLAVSFVLLIGAGLLLRTLVNLHRVDPGIDVENVLTMDIPANRSGRTNEQVLDFYETVRSRVSALPGVTSAAIASTVPLTGSSFNLEMRVDGYPYDPDVPTPLADYRSATPDYFTTVGASMLAGRSFASTDHIDAAKVVIVNQAVVNFYFPDLDPIGRRIRWSDPQTQFIGIDDEWRTIVGVVADTREFALDRPATHAVFQPFAQEIWPGSLLIRTATEPTALTRGVVRIIRELAGDQPIENIQTLAQIRLDTMAPRRLNATLVGLFAILALAIAAIGVSGVLAFSVSQRTNEFGIRIAMGADQPRVLRMVLKDGAIMLGMGLAIGGAAAVAVSRLLSGLLFEIAATDPLTFAGVALVLVAVALGASLAPAWRASRVEPVEALRAE